MISSMGTPLIPSNRDISKDSYSFRAIRMPYTMPVCVWRGPAKMPKKESVEVSTTVCASWSRAAIFCSDMMISLSLRVGMLRISRLTSSKNVLRRASS